jgi:diacylglycerol kinase family enzyme
MTSLAVVTNQKKVDTSTRESIDRALSNAGFGEAPWYEAKSGSAATPAAERALEDGADVVLAVGGDGTLRACAHAVAGTSAALAVVPTGTANLFASALSLPKDPAEVVQLILGGAIRLLDVGSCNGMRFNVMAGSGFDAELMRAVDDGPKDRFGTLAYIWEGVREVRRQKPLDVRVDIDGSTFYEGAATCVLVGNLGKLKAGVFAFPDASPIDGRLEVGVLSAASMRQWAEVGLRLVTRRPDASPHVQMSRGERIDVTWAPGGSTKQKRRAKETPYELDGGQKGMARKLHYRCEPRALRLVVPSNTDGAVSEGAQR